MAKITMQVDSRRLQLVHRQLKLLPDRITEGAQEAVKESGEAIRHQVSDTVRVDTGRLKERVRVRLIGALGLTADVGWFDHDTYYAQFQEFGTSRISADPVLTRAGEMEQREFPKRLTRHVKDKL